MIAKSKIQNRKSKIGKRDLTIDIHAHFFPEAYLRLIDEEGAPFGLSLRRDNSKGPILLTGVANFGPLRADFWDPEIRLKEMDRQKVRIHALSLTAPMAYPADGPLGLKLAQAWNDAEIGRAHV